MSSNPELPQLNEQGLLPPGIHDATLEVIENRFGAFRVSDQRVRLMAQLSEFVEEARRCAVVVGVIVDGSFITSKQEPNDIDVILLLDPDQDLAQDLPPVEYNVLSSRRVRKRWNIDVLVAPEGSCVMSTYVELFAAVREQPGAEKGLVRVCPWQ
jgi:hypothetical protein